MTPDQLERFHSGDEEIFGALVASLGPAIRRQVDGYAGRDRDFADDMYSAVLERLFDRRRDYRGEGPIGAWAFRLCARICLDHLRTNARAKRRVKPLDTPPGIATDSRLEGERVMEAERLEARLDAITDAVVSLPPRMRVVALSHWFLGHSAAHIAHQFALTPPTVWTTLSKAKALLRSQLEPLTRTPSFTPPHARARRVPPSD